MFGAGRTNLLDGRVAQPERAEIPETLPAAVLGLGDAGLAIGVIFTATASIAARRFRAEVEKRPTGNRVFGRMR